MKKWNRSKWFAAAAVCGTLACGTALGASGLSAKTLDVQYLGIHLVARGKEVHLTDANGAAIEPFACNGTTYVPVRALGEAMGEEVTWDSSTNTVYIGTPPPEKTPDNLQPYDTNGTVYSEDAVGGFSMGGVYYTEGVALRFSYTLDYSGYAYYDLDGKYSSVEFDVGHLDGDDGENALLGVYVDDELVQDIVLRSDMETTHVVVPVSDAQELKLVKNIWRGSYGLVHVVGVE